MYIPLAILVSVGPRVPETDGGAVAESSRVWSTAAADVAGAVHDVVPVLIVILIWCRVPVQYT